MSPDPSRGPSGQVKATRLSHNHPHESALELTSREKPESRPALFGVFGLIRCIRRNPSSVVVVSNQDSGTFQHIP